MKPLVVLMVAASWPLFIWQVMNATKGVFGQITGAVNNSSRGLFDRNRKFRSNERQSAAKRADQGNRFQGGQRRIVDEHGNVVQRGNWRGRVNERAQRISALKTSIRDQGMVRGFQSSSIDTAIERSSFDTVMEMANSDDRLKHMKDNDTLHEAAMHVAQGEGIQGQIGTEASIREYLRDVQHQEGSELDQNVKTVVAARRALGDRNFQIFASVFNSGTGTGYQEGPDQMLAAIERAAGNDRPLAKRMAIAAKSMAAQSRRMDLGGFGVGAMVGQQDRIHAAASGQTWVNEEGVEVQETLEEALAGARVRLTDAALDTQGPGAILSMRGVSVRNTLPAMQRRIVRTMDAVGQAGQGVQAAEQQLAAAQQAGDQAAVQAAQATVTQARAQLQAAQRRSFQEFAATAAFQSLAQQVSPENARIVSDGLLSQTIQDPGSGTQVTIQQAIELMRTSQPQAFVELERQYQSRFAQEHAAAQQAATQGGPNNQPGQNLANPFGTP